MQRTVSARIPFGRAAVALPRHNQGKERTFFLKGSFRGRVVAQVTNEDEQEAMQLAEAEVAVEVNRGPGFSGAERQAEKAAKKIATTFAPKPSGKVKNPATQGTVLYDLFGVQAAVGAVAGALLSFNVLFPSDQPSIAKLLGMWSIWMFSIPSLRARECTLTEKDVLNILFLLLPLLNILLPFLWKSFPFVFSADLLACVAVYYWKVGSRSLKNKGCD